MILRSIRNDGTVAIAFMIQKNTSDNTYRVIFSRKYAVDVFQGTSYSDVIRWIRMTYNCANLNFDTVELC